MIRNRVLLLVAATIFIALPLFATQIYVPIDNPLYPFLNRLSVAGVLPDYNLNTKPVTRDYVAKMLRHLDNNRTQLSTVDQRLLDEYIADYRLELTNQRYPEIPTGKTTYFPLKSLPEFKNAVSNFWHYTPQKEDLHLMAYESGDQVIWFDVQEMFRYRVKNDIGRFFNQQSYQLSAQFGPHFSAYSAGYLYNYQSKQGFTEQPDEYKGGFFGRHNEFEGNVQYNSFDYAHAYVQYASSLGRFELGMRSMIWGNSTNSMILSNNVNPFPFIQWTKSVGKSRFTFMHGSIQPAEASIVNNETGSVKYAPKYIVGHRWEITLSNKLRGAFSEMVIYGDRDPELVYFIPTIFLWPVQHSLTKKNQDNILWFLEGEYFPINHVKLYGTLLIDELRFSEMFKDWSGNRWSVQGGLQIAPQLSTLSTDFTFEFTAVRPWTYTHRVPLFGTYTHGGNSLGFYAGPNSQLVSYENRWWLSRRSTVSIGYQILKHGESFTSPDNPSYYPVGNDPNQNYAESNPKYDHSTGWLFGDIKTTQSFDITWNYILSNVINLKLGYSYRDINGVGDNFLTFQLGFEY